jgi:anti-sigma regulatory factor (Ser/Thr protein kinase)
MTELRHWRIPKGNFGAAMSARRSFGKLVRAIVLPSSDVVGAELIFGELVANGVEHGSSHVMLTLFRRGGDLVLAVSDASGWSERLKADERPAPSQLRGRGLFFVRSVARAIEREPAGGSLRVVLPLKLNESRLAEFDAGRETEDEEGSQQG